MHAFDRQLLAIDGFERELLQRLLLENLLVSVAIDLEALETLVWGDHVRNFVEYLVNRLTTACHKAITFFVFADFYLSDFLVVYGLAGFVPELVYVPFVPSQLDQVSVKFNQAIVDDLWSNWGGRGLVWQQWKRNGIDE